VLDEQRASFNEPLVVFITADFWPKLGQIATVSHQRSKQGASVLVAKLRKRSLEGMLWIPFTANSHELRLNG
jgi:hypothetical protein